MLVVVSVVCVVAGIAVPSFLNSTRPMRLRNDAHALANMITMARMRAATEFAHVEVYCTPSPASGPGYCQLKSLAFGVTNAPANWVNEPQTIYLSQGVSFGIPPSISTPVMNQPTGSCPLGSASAYQGDAQQYTPCATTSTNNPVIVFNSRGIPVDPTGTTGTNGSVATSDYALYLKDASNNYYAVSVNQTGHPTLYWWNPTTLAFTRLLEYNDGSTS
jgi:type II secretory pathway pseudopilin PulG